MIVLRNARVIPELTPGFNDDRADIIIEDDKIADIVPAKTANGETVFDMTESTVIPGLIDAHVHLDLCGMDTFEENVQPDSFRVVRALRLAMDNLRKGYTTVRDLGDRNDIVISLANAVSQDLVMAPDILASGKIISPTESGNDFFGTMYA